MAKDQYKYFRIEARELLEGLNQCVLALEKGEPGKDLVGRILRLAHTLKGAARVVKQPGIAELAHALEDAFADCREERAEIPRERINQALGLADAIGVKVAALELAVAEQKAEVSKPTVEEFFETVRVEIEEVDMLLDGVSEASVQLTALRQESARVEQIRKLAGSLIESLGLRTKVEANGVETVDPNAKTRKLVDELRSQIERLDRNFATGIEQVDVEFAQVRNAANRLRLLPAATIFASLERSVRDAAQALHKEVAFAPSGGNHRLDSHVLIALRDALLHVVRNAVAHGIELPSERAKVGKPTQGNVELRIERRGTRVAFICRDDGCGIDVEAVRRAAVRRGLVAPADAATLGLKEVVKILMQGGVTTRGTVDEVSGRGIGLDVVRETAVRLKGEIHIASEAGRETSVEISVPVSLSSLTALEVDADGMVASLPLDAVRQILRVGDQEIVRSAEKDSIVYGGKVIPFMPLAPTLRKSMVVERRRRPWSAVILEATSGAAAIGVDRLLGTANIVVRPLPSLAEAEAFIAGASLDAEGNPQLVLDPEALVATAYVGKAPVSDTDSARRLPVLVIDDSLTTRMLEQSILESAGYEVEVATSAEEGIGKAREKQYALFLVDVEMPGMDGFEFVSHTQADAGLRMVPSILVTSRNAVEDRRRGEQVGARAYIVKGEFDQGYLLKVIRELIG